MIKMLWTALAVVALSLGLGLVPGRPAQQKNPPAPNVCDVGLPCQSAQPPKLCLVALERCSGQPGKLIQIKQ